MALFKRIGDMFDPNNPSKKNTIYESKDTATAIAHLKMLGVDMVNKANSGHPGIVLGAAPIIYALYRNHLVTDPADPHFFNRDRFVLSAGHGSALQYAMLHLAGFPDCTIDDLKAFRQIHSKTPGHPETHLTAGVDASTGPLGQGVAMAVGMAMAEAFLSAKFGVPTAKPIDHRTYALMGDGCLEEGVAQEAFALAGRYRLSKLVVLYDSNNVQLDGWVADSTQISVKDLMASYGWRYLRVDDGTQVDDISAAIELAKTYDRPTLIEVKTIIGNGSAKQGSFEVHGAPIGFEDANRLRASLGLRTAPFEVDQAAYDDLAPLKVRAALAKEKFARDMKELQNKNPVIAGELNRVLNEKLTVDPEIFAELRTITKEATRNVAGKILGILSKTYGTLFGGSADLSGSTKIKGDNGNFDLDAKRIGRNVNYGVREFAMAAVSNGLSLHGGVIPIDSTFLSFVDYNKAAVRLGAINQTQAIHVYSHDSVFLGEDGPTHQPVEQIWGLRLIPGLTVWRPANVEESIAAFKHAMEARNAQTVIITSRLAFDFTKSTVDQALHGGYVIKPGRHNKPTLTLVATGSEVALAVQAAKDLEEAHPHASVAVASMPSVEIFRKQSPAYQASVISSPSLAVEAGSSLPWLAITDHAYGIDRFGASGTPDQLRTEYKFNKIDLINYVVAHKLV